MILVNGNVITVDDAQPRAQAVAIADGRILAVGTDAEVRAHETAATRVIDLGGRTVVPGLADNHFHSAGGGAGVDLSGARTLAEVLSAIAAAVREAAPGAVVVTNSDWHEAQLAEQRLPLRRDLDAVAPDHPVVVVRGGHEYVLTSAGLARWGITADTPVPAGGEISRYDDGSLNGELIDAAKDLVTLDPPPPRDVETRIADHLAEHARLHAAGLTSIRHPGGAPDQYELLAELKRRGELRIRVNFLFRARGARTAEELGAVVAAWPAAQDEGDEWLRVGGVKLGVDGGFEGGWMREPYAEPFGRGGTFHGLQTMPADRFTMAVTELNRRGWRVATHAVDDAAIDQVLAGYEAANAEGSIGHRRWTIEHGFIAAADQLARIRELGLVLSAQHHLYVAGPSLEQYWGRSRAERVTPVRTYLDHRIAVSLGSDSPVVPFPPLRVLYHFTTRDTITGGVFGPDERIRVAERLHVETRSEKTLPPVGSPALLKVQGRGGEPADLHRWPRLYDLHSTPHRSDSLARDNAGTRGLALGGAGRTRQQGITRRTREAPRRRASRRKPTWKQDRGPGQSTPEGWRTDARQGAGGRRPAQQRCSRY